MSDAEVVTTLRQILGEMIASAGRLLEVLSEEGNALANEDADTLDRTGTDKLLVVEQLEQLETRRLAAVTEFGPDADLAMLAIFDLEASSGEGQLSVLWQTVTAQIGRCNHANEINGAALRQRRDNVARALSVLQGTSADAGVYESTGKTANPCVKSARSPLGRV